MAIRSTAVFVEYDVGTNLTTDCMKNKVGWSDFEVVQPGWQ